MKFERVGASVPPKGACACTIVLALFTLACDDGATDGQPNAGGGAMPMAQAGDLASAAPMTGAPMTGTGMDATGTATGGSATGGPMTGTTAPAGSADGMMPSTDGDTTGGTMGTGQGTMGGDMAGATGDGMMAGDVQDTTGDGAMAAGGDPLAPTFTAIFENILIKGDTGNCMTTFCHGGAPNPMGNGNLQILFDDKDTTYANLMVGESTSPMCSGMSLVIPGDSANSLLVQKLDAAPPCGAQMPIGVPLTDEQVNQIATWIDMGAENN